MTASLILNVRQLVMAVRIQGHVVVVGCPIEKMLIDIDVVHGVSSSIELLKHTINLHVSRNVLGVLSILSHVEKVSAVASRP